MAEKTYTPTDGMASAARRALQWKKEGKRGGTRVGLARANQLARKEALSESTVMRMYSFFSRHAVDKQATGFSSGEDGFPSPGRVAWDLWGGDAGASWSKQKRDQIMNSRMNKSVWAGVFFPTEEPELVDLTEEDAPLDDPIVEESTVEEAIVDVQDEQAAPEDLPTMEDSVVEEEVIEDTSSEEAVNEQPEEAEEVAVVEDAIADESEVSEETSAE